MPPERRIMPPALAHLPQLVSEETASSSATDSGRRPHGLHDARAFLAEVEAGHAGKTRQLAEALRQDLSCKSPPAMGAALAQLRVSLEREAQPAARNRLLRGWVAGHRDSLLKAWSALGLPAGNDHAPTDDGDPPDDADRDEVFGDATDMWGGSEALDERTVPDHRLYTSVAVFDFDQTLTTKHVGVFEDLDRVVDVAFGGAARCAMIQSLFRTLRQRGVSVAIVSRNSSHVIGKALRRADLLETMLWGKIFGFEDFDDRVPKSSIVSSGIVGPLGLDNSRVLFVDDDPCNTRDLLTNCPGVKCIQPPRNGIGQRECDQILAWAREQEPLGTVESI